MKASKYLKQLLSAIVAAVKERSTSMRSKTSGVGTRLIIFGILRNKKLLMSAIDRKIRAIVGRRRHDGRESCNGNGGDHLVAAANSGVGRKVNLLQKLPSFVLLNSLPSFVTRGGSDSPLVMLTSEEEREEGVKRVTNQLHLGNAPSGSVVDLARSAAEGGGVEFRLEDEIDHVADVFIRRFHEQMKMQKLESFKRFCEMMERN
uniref:Uncharacterized protein n=1 Tax=Avena sativa TaxID=4498 RepID=A0ACD5XL66_AVESA